MSKELLAKYPALPSRKMSGNYSPKGDDEGVVFQCAGGEVPWLCLGEVRHRSYADDHLQVTMHV